MANFKLDELLRAVGRAVEDANADLRSRARDSYLSDFQTGRDGSLEPRCLQMHLPRDVVPEGEDPEGPVQVPQTLLSENSGLGIDELVFEFDCLVDGLTDDADEPQVSLQLGRALLKHTQPARMRLTYKSGPPAQGIAELNDKLMRKL